MNWFERHLNWTFFLAWLLANVLVYLSFLIPTSAASESEPSSGLLIFLDKNYSTLWNEANIPDFDKIQWSELASESPYKWQTGTLVVYLENIGKRTIEVSASATEKPGYAIPGISISSGTIILQPAERKPMTITINRSPEVLAWSSAGTGTVIYFNTSMTQSEDLDLTQIMFFILAALLVLGTEIWYLLQKRRSLFFLFLNLIVWIGFVILLSLENKATPEGAREFRMSDIYRSSEYTDKPLQTNYDFQYFQEVLSCPTCLYADKEARNRGVPWCNAPQPPDIVKNYCNTWQRSSIRD